jgi:hypothetical protein
MIRRLWMSLPKLIRFMLVHVANGMGLGTQLAKNESGLATVILFFQTAMTFGAVSMGVAVMNLGDE